MCCQNILPRLVCNLNSKKVEINSTRKILTIWIRCRYNYIIKQNSITSDLAYPLKFITPPLGNAPQYTYPGIPQVGNRCSCIALFFSRLSKEQFCLKLWNFCLARFPPGCADSPVMPAFTEQPSSRVEKHYQRKSSNTFDNMDLIFASYTSFSFTEYRE